MEQKTAQPWHQSQILGVYKFYDIRGTESRADKGHSQYNQEEVQCALALYARLRKEFPAVGFDYRIGVIAMYRGQLTMLKNAFKERYGQSIWSKIDFNTVDGFQGQEKDIIILSCVRAGTSLNTIGFLADPRRVNVSITRSRSSLYILGHAGTLERSDELWKGIVADARTRNLLVPVRFSLLASNINMSSSRFRPPQQPSESKQHSLFPLFLVPALGNLSHPSRQRKATDTRRRKN
jgi:senataxin